MKAEDSSLWTFKFVQTIGDNSLTCVSPCMSITYHHCDECGAVQVYFAIAFWSVSVSYQWRV